MDDTSSVTITEEDRHNIIIIKKAIVKALRKYNFSAAISNGINDAVTDLWQSHRKNIFIGFSLFVVILLVLLYFIIKLAITKFRCCDVSRSDDDDDNDNEIDFLRNGTVISADDMV